MNGWTRAASLAVVLVVPAIAQPQFPLVMKQVTTFPRGSVGWLPVVCGDINPDSVPDLAFGSHPPMHWQVWETSRHNRFRLTYADTARKQLGVNSGQFFPFEAGDFDQDGLPDLIGKNIDMIDTIHQTFYTVVAMMESPAIGSLPTRLAWYARTDYQMAHIGFADIGHDMDRDGLEEILTVSYHTGDSSGVIIFENRGNDRAEWVWNVGGHCPYELAVGDFDLDGRAEVAGCDDYVVFTIECTGDDQYWVPPWRDQTPHPNGGHDAFAGNDVDQNGKPEFFVSCMRFMGGSWKHVLYGYEATGDNTYERFSVDSIWSGGGNRTGACGDVDGDGVDDIVWSATNNVIILKASGPGRFERVWERFHTGDCKVALCDFNGNGYNEVVVGATHGHVYEVEAIRLLSLNSGGQLRGGDTVRLFWQVFDPPPCDSVGLFLRRDSTWLLDTIATGLAPADTPCVWVVPGIRADSCWVVAVAYNLDKWQWDETDEPVRVVTGIGEGGLRAAHRDFLDAVPNPAVGPVRISYGLARAGEVELAVFDRAGRRAATLASGHHGSGEYGLTWNRYGPGGTILAPGVYFLRLETGQRAMTRKLTLAE